jgi:hypothetical protein
MHLTSVGRGCNMILDLSPTPTGLVQENDAATYAAFGDGQRTLYNESLLAQTGAIPRGQRVIELMLPHTVTRGAIELRENLTAGQAITNYTIEFDDSGRDSRDRVGGGGWQVLALRNEACLTIGNRRIQYWENVNVSGTVRLTVDTLKLASGVDTTPHVRSVKVMDWSSAELDELLSGILAVE